MKIISWNVNGVRAAYKKGLVEFVERERPDILCLQETKAHPEQCEPPIVSLGGMQSFWAAAQRKGYSGVATFARQPIERVEIGLGHPAYDSEGRVVRTRHGDFWLYNIYFPNGGSGEERHQFKQRFLADLYVHLQEQLARGEHLIVVGDYNIAHRDIDVYNPVRLSTESGFLPEERAWLDRFFALGFVDTFRHFHPEQREIFTWWSQIERARVSNRGWRIDYICVSAGLRSRLQQARILDAVEGSDHCPVVVELGS